MGNTSWLKLAKSIKKLHNNVYAENDPPVNVRVKCPYCSSYTMVAEGGRGECIGCGAPVSPEGRNGY